MGDYTINGKAVSEREFKELEELFKRTSFSVAEIFKDGNVEKAEIEKFLDFDKNGFVSGDDLRLLRDSYPRFIFGKLVSILARHGFDVDKRITEHLSDGSAPTEATLKSRDLMLAAVEKDPAVLIYSPSLRRDHDFMIKCIGKNKNTSFYIDESLRDNPDFILDAIKIDTYAVFWASDKLMRDVGFVSRLLKEHEDMWDTIESAVKSPQTALLVMKRRMYNRHEVFERFMSCSAVDKFIPGNESELKADDIDLMAKAALIDFRYLSCVSPDLRPRLWTAMLGELKERGIEFPMGMRKDFDTFKKVLKEKYHIEHIGRFRSLATLHTVLSNRFGVDPDDKRPVALWIASKGDHNGAFDNFPMAEILAKDDKFRVYYYEVETDEDADSVKREVLRNGRHLHTLVISGHGERGRILLGKPEEGTFLGKIPLVGIVENAVLAQQNAKYFLDTDDVAEGKFGALLRAVVPGGQALLYSCSTGNGGAMARNMTNAVAQQVASGVSVYSPMRPISDMSIEFKGLKMAIQYKGIIFSVPAYNVTASR